MNRSRTAQEVANGRRMQDLGVPLELDEEEPTLALVRQRDSDVENCVFDVCRIGTGLRLSLSVTSCVSALGILAIDVELPWLVPRFRWLQDPREANDEGSEYLFPGSRYGYQRDIVINHRIGLKHLIPFGHSLEGLLLGAGLDAIPPEFGHGLRVPITLEIIDQFDHREATRLEVWVDRSERAGPRRKSKREPLFAECDKGCPGRKRDCAGTRRNL